MPRADAQRNREKILAAARDAFADPRAEVSMAEVSRRAFVATSLPAWPGWRADTGGRPLPVTTVNHAFVGFWVPPGTWPIRLSYRPASFSLGLLAMAAGLAASIALARVRPRGKPGENPPQ